jgi:hypothetical protein
MPATKRLLVTVSVKHIGEDGLPFGDIHSAEREIPVDKLYPFAPEKRMIPMRAAELGVQVSRWAYDALVRDGVA